MSLPENTVRISTNVARHSDEGLITFYCWWCHSALTWHADKEKLWCPTCDKPRGPNE
jgi:hypothetical protein